MKEKGSVVLSFDDGREDLFRNVIPLLKKYNVPATFNITTGYVDGTLKEENYFCKNKPITLGQLQEIKKEPLFEIAAHGDQHLNTKEDIEKSISKLEQWGVIERNCGFASPCHGLDILSYKQIEELRVTLGLSYIRIGTKLSRRLISRIIRRLVLMLSFSTLFQWMYKRCFNRFGERIYKCIPYNKRMNLSNIEDTVLRACNLNMVVVILFHSILKAEDDYYDNIENIDYNQFEQFCSFLNEKRQDGLLLIKCNCDVLQKNKI